MTIRRDRYNASTKNRDLFARPCWHRLVAALLIVTLSSSLVAPLFASYEKSAVVYQGSREEGGSTSRYDKRSTIASDLLTQRPYKLGEKKVRSKTGPLKREQQTSLLPAAPITVPSPANTPASKKYQPYLEVGGRKYFGQGTRAATTYDLFLPLRQTEDQLLFADLRIFAQSSSSFEGNAHLGFRKLFAGRRQLIGVYAAFDRKRSIYDKWFSQFTVGVEYWYKRWFVGGNLYQPIGKRNQRVEQSTPVLESVTNSTMVTQGYIRAMGGVDGEIGFACTERITGYLGGYYFHAKDSRTKSGPKLRLTYNYTIPQGRFLGILDGIEVEGGVQHDQVRGYSGYLGINFKIGLTELEKNSNISGFARHMVEPVRRDPDIVLDIATTTRINQSALVPIAAQDKFPPLREKREMIAKLLVDFGLASTATWQEVQAQYKKLVLAYHPDRNPQGAAKFIKYRRIYVQLKQLRAFLAQETNVKPPSYYNTTTTSATTEQPSPKFVEREEGEVPFIADEVTAVYFPPKQVAANMSGAAGPAQFNWSYRNRAFYYSGGSYNGLAELRASSRVTRGQQYHKHAAQSSLVLAAFRSKSNFTLLPHYNRFFPLPPFVPLVEQYSSMERRNMVREDTSQGIIETPARLVPQIGNGPKEFSYNSSLSRGNHSIVVTPPWDEEDRQLAIGRGSGSGSYIYKVLCYLDNLWEQILAKLMPWQMVEAVDLSTPTEAAELREERGTADITANYPDIDKIISVLVPEQENRGGHGIEDLAKLLDLFMNNPPTLSAEQGQCLEQLGREGVGNEEDNRRVKPLIFTILAHYMVQPEANDSSVEFLVEHAKQDHSLLDVVIEKFTTGVMALTEWPKQTIFSHLVALLPYDKDNKLLTTFIYAHKFHGYLASAASLSYFIDLLDSVTEQKEGLLKIITDSLQELLAHDVADIVLLEQYVDILRERELNLPCGLLDAVFSYYIKDPAHFGALVMERLAQDREIPFTLLEGLAGILEELLATKSYTPQIMAFMGLRLGQNHIPLSEGSLRSFIQLLNDAERLQDRATQITIVELLYKLRQKIPERLMPQLSEALIALVPQVEEWQRTKIYEIVDGLLDDQQKLRLQLQQQIVAWSAERDLARKLEISRELYNSITAATCKEANFFLKKLLATQSAQFFKVGAAVFTKLHNCCAVTLTAKMQELLDEFNKTQSIEWWLSAKFYSLKVHGNEFLLSVTQWAFMQEQFKRFTWDIKEQLQHINFVTLAELHNFLDFLLSNNISEHTLNELLADHMLRGVLDVAPLYEKLLEQLIAEIKPKIPITVVGQEVLTNSIKSLVTQVAWPADFLFGLLKQAAYRNSSTELSTLMVLLFTLAQYRVGLTAMVDSNGVSVRDLLQQNTHVNLLPAVNKLINDNHYFVKKDINTLYAEFKAINQNNSIALEIIAADLLTKVYELLQNGAAVGGVAKPLPEWQGGEECYTQCDEVYHDESFALLNKGCKKVCDEKNDFIIWRQSLSYIDYSDNKQLVEVIAVLAQAVHETILNKENKGKKFYPRPAQILALLSLLKSFHGDLVEISTGEGKTLIIAMLVGAKVIEGRVADIITSYEDLAVRDAKDNQRFYNLLGIGVGHNIGVREGGKPKECYAQEVVYGDILHFNGDALWDILENVKLGRGFDILISDEVDHLGIDQSGMKIQLSRDSLGLDILNQLLIYMWGTAKRVRSMLRPHPEPTKCRVLLDASMAAKLREAGEHKRIYNEAELDFLEIDQSCVAFLEDLLADFVKTELFAFDKHIKKQRLFVVPSHLEEFVTEHLPHWLRSISISLSENYREGVDYIVDRKDSNELLTVVPVDRLNGALLHKLQLSDGLHQFLQMKHALMLSAENMISFFMSYYGYFNKHRGRIYGTTGTTGTDWHHKFFREVYEMPITIVPRFAHKDVVEFTDIVAQDTKEWQEKIVALAKIVAGAQHRAVLIVMETIEQVKNIERLLLQTQYDRRQIFTYGIGSDNKYALDVKRELNAGDIIVATNLAGRGTDLVPNLEVLRNGGLHVITTTLARSKRIDDQVAGRTGRNGEPGSIQKILNLVQLKNRYINNTAQLAELKGSADIINYAIAKRDEQDRYDLITGKQNRELPRLRVMDKLFSSYVELLKEIATPTNYKLELSKPDEANLKAYTLYLYGEDAAIRLKIVAELIDGVKEDLNITELIQNIDFRAAKHLQSILFDTTSANIIASLNQQEYELIHFIAAHKGYIKNTDIYTRICSEFILEQGTQTEENYLRELIKDSDNFPFFQADITINKELLAKVKLRKLFLLWLEDRKIYNHEYEIRQLNEYWGYWLRRYADPLVSYVPGIKETTGTLATIEQDLKENFAIFSNEMQQRFTRDDFIKNKDYYILKSWRNLQIYYSHHKNNGEAPLITADRDLEKALALENTYSWNTHNTRAYLRLIKNGRGIYKEEQGDAANRVNEDFYKDVQCVIDKINQVEIPLLEERLTVLSAQEMGELYDDIVIETIARIEYYKKVIEVHQKNVANAAKAVKEQGIVIAKEVIDTNQFIQSINITVAALQNLGDKEVVSVGYKAAGDIINSVAEENKRARIDHIAQQINSKQEVILKNIARQTLSKGGILIETGVYKLEKKPKNWFGSIFSAVMGLAFICVGVLLAPPAGGIFMSILSKSLVIKGIGDIVSSLISVAADTPIDLTNYLKSTAISIGIIVVTAGVLRFADKVMGNIKALDLLAGRARDPLTGEIIASSLASNPIDFITKTTMVQAATTMASFGIYDLVGRKMVKPEDIREKARAEAANIIKECKAALQKIFAVDSLSDSYDILTKLYDKINDIASEYLDTFNSIEAQFATEIPIDIANNLLTGLPAYGLGNIIHTTVELSKGFYKNAKALAQMSSDTKKAIQELAAQGPTMWELMQEKFAATFVAQDFSQLVMAIEFQGYVADGVVTCGNLGTIDLDNLTLSTGSQESYKEDMITLCNEVDNALHAEYNYDKLKTEFAELVTATITYIRKDIAKSGSQAFSSFSINLLERELDKRLEEQEREKNIAEGLQEQLSKEASNSQREYLVFDSAYAKARKEFMQDLYSEKATQDEVLSHPETKPYIVKRGDSLSTIAARQLGKKATAKEVAQLVEKLITLNPELATNPDYIREKQILRLPLTRTANNYEDSNLRRAVQSNVSPRAKGLVEQLWATGLKKHIAPNWWERVWDESRAHYGSCPVYREAWGEPEQLDSGNTYLAPENYDFEIRRLFSTLWSNTYADKPYYYEEKNKAAGKQIIILDDKNKVNEDNLAWLVGRYKNFAKEEKVEQPSGTDATQLKGDQKYIPIPIPSDATKHWGIMMSDKKIVGYFPDSSIKKDEPSSKGRLFYERIKVSKISEEFEVGFDNALMLRAIQAIEKSWGKTGEKYHYLTHNCHHFVYAVVECYQKMGGVLYYKKRGK